MSTSVEPGLGTKVRRGLAWSTGSNLILRIANLLVGAIMARLIAPSEFGVFAVALTVWLLLGALAEFGLGADLIRREDFERHIPTVATLGVLLSTGLASIMALAARPIAVSFGSGDATRVIQVMAISLMLVGFSVVPAALLQRALRQGAVMAIEAIGLVVSTGVLVVLALEGMGPMALALSKIVSQLLIIALQYAAVRRTPRFGWDREVVGEAVVFGAPLAGANLVSWAVMGVGNLVVARMTSPVELGLYALAFNVASWPMAVAGQSVRVIALPAFSRLGSARERARALVIVSGPMWAISLIMALGLMFMAPEIVTVLYGQRWHGAAVVVMWLAAYGAVRVVFDLLATYLVAANQTRAVLWVQLLWLAVLVPALIAGIDRFGLAGAGLAQLVAAVVVLPAYLFFLHRVEVPWAGFLGAWLLPTAAAGPVIVVLAAIAHWVDGAVVAMLAAGLAGALCYVLPLLPWIKRRVGRLADIADITDPEPEVDPSSVVGGAVAGQQPM